MSHLRMKTMFGRQSLHQSTRYTRIRNVSLPFTGITSDFPLGRPQTILETSQHKASGRKAIARIEQWVSQAKLCGSDAIIPLTSAVFRSRSPKEACSSFPERRSALLPVLDHHHRCLHDFLNSVRHPYHCSPIQASNKTKIDSSVHISYGGSSKASSCCKAGVTNSAPAQIDHLWCFAVYHIKSTTLYSMSRSYLPYTPCLIVLSPAPCRRVILHRWAKTYERSTPNHSKPTIDTSTSASIELELRTTCLTPQSFLTSTTSSTRSLPFLRTFPPPRQSCPH